MRARLLAVLLLAALAAGCTEPIPLETRDPEAPISTRDSRGAGTFSDESYTVELTNSTPKLHFYKRGMSRYAPDGSNTNADRLVWPPDFVNFRAPPEFRYNATNNGTITRANGTFWFRVTELTPTTPYLACELGVDMRLYPRTGPGYSYRSIRFCNASYSLLGSGGSSVLTPGTYSLNLTATLTAPTRITAGDQMVFVPVTSGFSPEQHSTVYFLSGSRIHDSKIHFEGWEQQAEG